MTNASDESVQPQGAAEPPPALPAGDSGVIDRIQVPAPVSRAGRRLRSAWDRLPLVGRAFVALAVLDVVGRALGVAGTSLFIDLANPSTLVSAFLPHDLLILLPALIVARRPDAPSATPLILRAAVLLALVELLAGPVAFLSLGGAGAGGYLASTAIAIAASVLKAVGWVALAIGLAGISVARPGLSVAGLSNLVVLLMVGGAIVSLALLLIVAPPNLGDPLWDTMSLLASAVVSIEAVAFAYLARVVVRGTGDARRPPLATYLGSAAMVVAAVAVGIAGVVGAIAIVQLAFNLSTGSLGGSVALGWAGVGLPLTALLVAFGLGLADTSVRIPDGAPALELEPGEDAPAWPAPGREVPTWRQPTPPAKQRRSKRQA